MARHDQHGLGDQSKPALLHDGRRHGHRLTGADSMGKIGRAIGNDPPDAAFLVPIQNKGARSAREFQVGAVEFPRRDIVETIIVVAGQPVGSIRIGPDPVLKCSVDPLELVARGFRIDDIEDPALTVGILKDVEDLRDPAIQRIGEQIACMAAAGSPFRCAGGAVTELSCLHRPGPKLRHVVDADFRLHLLPDEGDDIGGRDPRGAEAGCDVGWPEISRLDLLEGADIALIGGVELGRCLRGGELCADGP